MTTAIVPPARVALVTHPVEGADELARRLVERGVAACVNLVAVRSVYRWQGEVHDDPETLLVVKTVDTRLAELSEILARDHPYDVPELVVLAPTHVEARYLAWLLAETGGLKGEEA
jgi:periplasmic divalent cation tolerance protein